MERFPTKSVILERAETVGSVGFLISSCVVVFFFFFFFFFFSFFSFFSPQIVSMVIEQS